MRLFPELSEQGNQDALHLIERFKSKLQDVANEEIGKLYCDLLPHIETDSWTNYREELRLSLYKQTVCVETSTSKEAWASSIREAIFTQFRSELEQGIIADQQREIEKLKSWLNERRYL